MKKKTIPMLVMFSMVCACSRLEIPAQFVNTPTAPMTPTQTPRPTPIRPTITPTPTFTPRPLPTIDAVAGCVDEIGCAVIAPDEPIHIAYILSMSGQADELGEVSKGGIEIAIDDHGGRLLGHDILLTGEDTECSLGGGQIAAFSVASDPTTLGVIGTNCSESALRALSTINKAGLVMLSPSNTNPELTLVYNSWQPGYYRIAHTDLLEATLAAEFAFHELGARTAATIQDGSSFSEGLQRQFVYRFRELGGTITSQGTIRKGDLDMRNALAIAAAREPDVLYFPIFESEGIRIVTQASNHSGLNNTVLLSADGLMLSSFPKKAGVDAIGMVLSGPYVHGEAFEALQEKWDAKFRTNPPNLYYAFAYDATNLLLSAIEKVAAVDGDGNIYIGRQALRDTISATTDFPGITGTLDCSDKDSPIFGTGRGDCASGESLAIFEITQGETQGRWPPKAIYPP